MRADRDKQQRPNLLPSMQDLFATTGLPDCHTLSNYIVFMLRLCKQGPPFPLAISWSSFDQVVLSICLSELSDISMKPKIASTPFIHAADELFSLCVQVLNTLSASEDATQLLRGQYDLIHTFWPPRQRHEFVKSSYCSLMSRTDAPDPMQIIEKHHVEQRLVGIKAALDWENGPNVVNYIKISKELVQLPR
jgi:hypothetical protein